MQEATSYLPYKKEISYIDGMEPPEDPVRKLVADKADAYEGGLSALSKALGLNHAYLQQYVRRGVPAALPEDVRAALAQLLDVPEAELRGASGRSRRVTPAHNAKVAGPVALNRSISAYGHARGGRDGQFPLNGNKVAELMAPPSLATVPDAYAVYVAGISMEPRYYAGEAVYVNPRKAYRKGDFVVAQISAEEGDPPDAYVKRFLSLDEHTLRLEQLNPKKALKFPAKKVVSIHRIVLGGDG